MRYKFFEPVANILRHTANTITEPRQRDIGRLNVREKADQTLLTDADEAAEKYLTEQLPLLILDSKVLGEEATRDWRLSPVWRGKGFVWIIDPIDGTRPYKDGGEYGIMVSLRFDGIIQAAWIFCPKTQDMLFASLEDEAHLVRWNEEGIATSERISIPSVALSDQALHYYCPPAEDKLGIYAPVTTLFANASRVASTATEVRSLLLTGIDAHLFVGHFTPWDNMGTNLIINRAGGAACFLSDGGDDPVGIIHAPSRPDMEKMLAAVRAVNPKIKIVDRM